MKLSARSRYAARILLELAKQSEAGPMSASTLSLCTGVSVQFVEQILKPLKLHGLTKSVRGAAGGHKLAKSADEITLGEVVRLMEGGIHLTVCCGETADNCTRKDSCLTRQAWVQVSSCLERELDSILLAGLLHRGLICPAAGDVTGKKKDEKNVNTRTVAKGPRRVGGSTRILARRIKTSRK